MAQVVAESGRRVVVAVASAAAASGTPGLEGAGFGNWPSGENGSRNRCRSVARAPTSNYARIDWAARSKAHQGRPQAHRRAVRMRRSAGRGSPRIPVSIANYASTQKSTKESNMPYMHTQ